MTYSGSPLICKTLAMEYPSAELWTGNVTDNLEFILLEFMDKVYGTDKAAVTSALEQIDSTMVFCLHPLAFEFTVGDFLLWGAVKGNSQITTDVLSGKYREIERWYKQYMETLPHISKVNDYVKELSAVYPFIPTTLI